LGGLANDQAPAFADLDNDGDLDGYFGDGIGRLHWIHNVGTPENPSLRFTASYSPFGYVDVDARSVPSFLDIDGDLDYDLVVSLLDGSTRLYENTGTIDVPVFASPVNMVTFGLTDFGSPATTAFADIDGDGDEDAFIATSDGIFFFRQESVGPPPKVSISALSADKAEGDSGTTDFTFTVTRTGDTSGSSTVQWFASGAGANPAEFGDPSDFVGVRPHGTLTFAAGETSKIITVPVQGDSIEGEGDDAFVIQLLRPINAEIDVNSAIGVIRDDDVVVAPKLSISALSADKAEGDSGTTDFTFTVTRDGDTRDPSTVQWFALGAGANPVEFGTSGAPTDFVGVRPHGTLTFAAGETSKVITVPVLGDGVADEGDETFAIQLLRPVNAEIDVNSAIGVIREDDVAAPVAPKLSISALSADKAEGDSGTTDFTFAVMRDGDTSGSSTVQWFASGAGANPV
jgi:hypothetical protein